MTEAQTQRYGLTILLHCGGGAYGDVYYCRDASGRELALKVLSKAKVGSGWERELKGITHYRQLTDGNAVLLQLYHVGQDDEAFYYTMELADAVPDQPVYAPDTLAWRLTQGALPSEQLLPTLEAILTCVRTLHEAGFAHRDIKPENILFVHGKPKLADLGLLSPLSGTMTQLAGTLDFLPPEERTGETPNDSHASRQRNDLYAFGKIIYCCVTGNGANEFPSIPQQMPLTQQNKFVFRLAMRLCDKEPTRRLCSMDELIDEFARVVHGCQYGETVTEKICYTAVSACRHLRSLGVRTCRTCRRHWLFSMNLGCLVIAGLAWLGKTIASRPDKDSEELAQTLQDQKKTAATTQLSHTDFTFYNGMYSLAVPTEWQAFDHDEIAKSRPPGDGLVKIVHGILSPKQADGNETIVVSILILPLTAEQLKPLNDSEKIAVLKAQFANDIEALSIRQYRNQRLNLDTILFVGELAPAKASVNYIYPQADHTLCLCALIPYKLMDAEMGKFLAITDSLVYRMPSKTPQK